MRLKLSIEEKEEVRRLQRNAVGTPDYVRLTCILMFDNGRSSKSISEDLGISIATVYRYVGDYQSGGMDNLLEQPTVSGRDRVNINGLLNAYDVTDVIAHDCESVNVKSHRELYEEALSRHPEASCIYIISDNARYYHNKELREWAEGTRIKQIFIPPYSPNLNLIERLWKFLRKKVINTGFYRTKEEFRRAIRRFFDNIESFKEELESLLTLKFRLCNSQTISF